MAVMENDVMAKKGEKMRRALENDVVAKCGGE
jgi:hypothetical protein